MPEIPRPVLCYMSDVIEMTQAQTKTPQAMLSGKCHTVNRSSGVLKTSWIERCNNYVIVIIRGKKSSTSIANSRKRNGRNLMRIFPPHNSFANSTALLRIVGPKKHTEMSSPNKKTCQYSLMLQLLLRITAAAPPR